VSNNVFASALNVYRGPDQLVALNAQSVTNVGGSQAHLNMQPFLGISFCIALQGIFPSPN
jgi:microcystin-dependent protein